MMPYEVSIGGGNAACASDVRVYVHAKSGAVHALAGPPGACIRFKAAADYLDGDSWTLNGTPVNVTYQGGEALLPTAILKDDMVIGVLDGEHLRLFLQKPTPQGNLLINGDSGINQRKTTEYPMTAGWAYTVDGWRAGNASVTVTGDGVRVVTAKDSTYKRYAQMVERPLRAGETYTIAALARCNEIGGSAILRPVSSANGHVAGAADVPLSAGLDYRLVVNTFTSTADYDYFGVEILSTSPTPDSWFDVDLRLAKLEPGSRFTGWPETDPAVELARCQRYQVQYPGTMALPVAQYNANSLWAYIALPAPMRAVPVLAGGSIQVFGQGPALTTEIGGFTPVSLFLKENILGVTLSKTNHGYNGANMSVRLSNALFEANL